MSQLIMRRRNKSPWGLQAVMVTPPPRKKERNAPRVQCVKPNKMLQAEQTVLIRYLAYKKPVACAVCGKKRLRHWTTLVPFRAVDLDDPRNLLATNHYSAVLAPFTPVCPGHLLAEEPEVMGEMVVALRWFFDLTYARLVKEAQAAARNSKT